MQINFFCQFNHTGIGKHSECFYRALWQVCSYAEKINYIDRSDDVLVRHFLEKRQAAHQATIFFWRHDPRLLQQVRGKKIIWLVFESTRLPPKWVDQLSHYDEIWVPSEWGRAVLMEHGIPGDKTVCLAEGVSEDIYFPQRSPRESFVFLSVGKYEKRKSTDEIVSAFLQEFPPDAGATVELWLKADFPMFLDRVSRLRDIVRHDPRIKVISGVFTECEMADLYNKADAFLFPSKAEGFGLPCLEALACGLPTLALNYSGQSEYLNALEGLFIPIEHALEEIEDKDYEYFYKGDYGGSSYGEWAIPDIASIRQGMRRLYAEHEIWVEKASIASSIVREKFTWRAAAKRALGRLSK